VFTEANEKVTARTSARAGHAALVPIALVLLGAALRLHVFLVNHALSIDEAAIARNVIDRSWVQLLRPLDYAQAAPPGFLIAEKIIASALGSGEYALRLFPLVCGVVSLWLCWAVSRRILSRAPALCALALCALNNALVDHSVLAKQYSSDVAAALLVVFVAIDVIDRPCSARRALWSGLAGAATVVFSFTAVFVLAGAACAGVLAERRRQTSDPRAPLLIASTLWLAGASIGGLIGRFNLTPADAEYMHWWWRIGFMPMPPDLDAMSWVWRRLGSVFSLTGQYRASFAWIGLISLGGWSLHRRGRAAVAWVLGAPLVLQIAASAARLYPFIWGRLQLFLLPLLLILVSEGTGYCLRVRARRYRWLGAIPMAFVLALAAYSTVTGDGRLRSEDVRPFLQHVRRDWHPRDRLYVHYGMGQAFFYYAPRYGFTADEYLIATCSIGSARAYLRQIDTLRGAARAWVLMSHSGGEEADLIIRYLGTFGTLDSRDVANSDAGIGGTGVGYLYDLSAATAFPATADRFPVPADLDHGEPFPFMCHGVLQPLVHQTAR
jgi:hypothetical protein